MDFFVTLTKKTFGEEKELLLKEFIWLELLYSVFKKKFLSFINLFFINSQM